MKVLTEVVGFTILMAVVYVGCRSIYNVWLQFSQWKDKSTQATDDNKMESK